MSFFVCRSCKIYCILHTVAFAYKLKYQSCDLPNLLIFCEMLMSKRLHRGRIREKPAKGRLQQQGAEIRS